MDTTQLQDRDYVLFIDKSGSMTETDTPEGSRWKSVQETVQALTNKITEFDKDGITLYPFNSQFKRHDNVTPAVVQSLWTEHEPMGGTNHAAALQHAFDSYFARKQRGETKPNGEMFLVITDGIPSNGNEGEQALRNVIINATKKMDRDEELGVSFIQVGRDAHATAFLKQLDDGLVAKGAKYDIVDTVTVEELNNRPLIDVLISAITD